MKISYSLIFFLSFLAIHKANGGVIKAPLHIISLEDVTNAERQQLKAIGEQYERTKRSGSGSPDFLSSLKYILASGAKAKLTLLGRASAAASSSIASSSSSSKSYGDHEYVYHHHPEEEIFLNDESIDEAVKKTEIERTDRSSKPPKSDPWSAKKSVLNTLLQAVKAIKGGVLALKGQLIKGGGYLLVGGGNLVKSKGEVISNLGKKIARNAFRDMHPDHSSEVHEDGSYGHFHSIGTKYGPPSEPIHVDHFPQDFHDPYPDKTPGPQSGILILKRAPSLKEPHSLHGSETKVASIAAVEPDPHFGSIVGKLLSAASSLNPDSPAPFTNYKHPEPIQITADQDVHADDSDQHDQGNLDSDFELEPAFDSPEANKIIEPHKTGEVKFGPENFSIEHQAENHSPPKPPSVDQSLPHISANVEHEHPQISTIHVNNDLNHQLPLENPHPGFSNINKPNQFDITLNSVNSGPFAEPPTSYQSLLNFNTQSAIGNSIHIPESSNPQLAALNYAEPLPLKQGPPHQEVLPPKDNFNPGPPFNMIPYNPSFFEQNFAAPPKTFFHYDDSLDLQAPPKFEAERPTYFPIQNSLTAGVKIDNDLRNIVEVGDKKSSQSIFKQNNKLHSIQPPRKPTKNYNTYRGVVRETPVLNPHIVNPSSQLDLPHLTQNVKKFNPNGRHSPKYPSFIERPSPPNKSIYGLNPPSANRNKPFSQPYREQPLHTRNKAHSQPHFDIIPSVTYQLGPNGPKMI